MELELESVVIASETGRSALAALEVFRESDVKLIVVTHYPSSTMGPEGKIPIGLKRPEYLERLKRLQEHGASIVQGTRPLVPPSRTIEWEYPTPEAIIDKTLEVFGAGTKIAIEAVLMAADAGEVETGQDVVACAGTFKGLDTGLVLKAANSASFFSALVVREIIAKPRCRVEKLPEHQYSGWKGDLQKYYPD
jgi:hypothetical protein